MKPAFDLMLITDEAPLVVERVRQALVGVPPARVAVQLRHKGLPTSALTVLARSLRELTREHGAWLLINGNLDVGLAADADGVQLPENGVAADVARARLGTDKLIGCSCHDAAGLARAARL